MMPKATRFIAKLFLVCFGIACLYWFATANVNEICGLWCSGPPSDLAFTECAQRCWEVLR